VTTVTYTKPEFAALGNANQLIQGVKNAAPEGSIDGPQLFELEE
jgi:hypothetical protein